MGRPLNKKHFGTGAGADFKVRAKLDTGAEGYGFIVKQTATKTFDVNIGGTVGRCVLVDKATGTLAAGEMTISARDADGDVARVVKLAGRKLTLNDGTVVAWDFDAATDGKVEMEEEADTFSDPAPVITIGTQPANRTVTAPATANFAVVATVTGGATLSYQWQSRANSSGTFANVSGATAASYTTPATVTGDTGKQFRCIVSATGGATSVNSSTVTLTVN